jgi:hypothetical protein
VVVDDDEGHLVLIVILKQLPYHDYDLDGVVAESHLRLEFQLIEDDVLERDLREQLVFEYNYAVLYVVLVHRREVDRVGTDDF